MQWSKVGDTFFQVSTPRANGRFLVQTLPFRVFRLPATTTDSDINEWVRSQPQVPEITFDNFFALDVLATTECNFRCTYCYALASGVEGFYGLEPKRMDSIVARRTADLGIRRLREEINRGHGQNARFDLFVTGGEPMLNFDNVVTLLDRVREGVESVSSHYGIPVAYSPEIATNASLITEEMANILKHFQVQVAVTVDGSSHNERRPFRDGSASLDRVLEGIHYLVSSGNKVKLQSVVPLGNSGYLEDLFTFYQERGLLKEIRRVHVIPQAAPILDRYFNQDKSVLGFDDDIYERYSRTILRLSKDLNLDIKNYQGRLSRSINMGGLAHRCPVGCWKLAVTPVGALYPCHQLINIPEFYMGNVNMLNDEMNAAAEEVTRTLRARTVFRVEPCNDCIFQTICIPFVDCPARCFLEAGNLYRVPEHYCRVHRPYMEELLEEFIVQSDQRQVEGTA